jgi:hypothetical protein
MTVCHRLFVVSDHRHVPRWDVMTPAVAAAAAHHQGSIAERQTSLSMTYPKLPKIDATAMIRDVLDHRSLAIYP